MASAPHVLDTPRDTASLRATTMRDRLVRMMRRLERYPAFTGALPEHIKTLEVVYDPDRQGEPRARLRVILTQEVGEGWEVHDITGGGQPHITSTERAAAEVLRIFRDVPPGRVDVLTSISEFNRFPL